MTSGESLGRAVSYVPTLLRLLRLATVGLARRKDRWTLERIGRLLVAEHSSLQPSALPIAPPHLVKQFDNWLRSGLDAGAFAHLRVASPESTPAGQLDPIALRHGTDKSSSGHGYSVAYEREFAGFRQFRLRLLEIGVYRGESLSMWREYFPRGEVFGIDIDDACRIYPGVFLGDQSDAGFLKEVEKAAGPFDIVIDDGSHYAPHQLVSFLALWPGLKSGGCYVVEDLHTAYRSAQEWRPTIMPVLTALVDCCMKHGKLECGRPWAGQLLTRAERDVAAVHFYPSIAFIWKS